QRQLLFDSIKWDGANIVFPVPEAKGVLREEKAGVARRAVESACAVNGGIAGLFHDVARRREKNLVSKIGKLYEASLVNVDDSQRDRESRLRGVTNGLQTEDVQSKSSREKFKAGKTGRAVLPRFNGQGYSFSSNYHNSFFAKKEKFDQSRQNQFKGKGNYSAEKFGKFNKNRFNNTQDEDKPSP
ncbi:MAG: hypothetical protein EZS28_041773, partial [Streblomastix strix]